MYKIPYYRNTCINSNVTEQRESIEKRYQRMLENKEPMDGGAQLIYTERKDGVMPAYNIRTDRFDVAVEGMQAVSKSYQARRENKGIITPKPIEGSGEVGEA